jgi:hypothetical protein
VFKVVEEKRTSVTYTVWDESGFGVITATGDKTKIQLYQDERISYGGAPKELSKYLRQLADSLTKVASKLEGIK